MCKPLARARERCLVQGKERFSTSVRHGGQTARVVECGLDCSLRQAVSVTELPELPGNSQGFFIRGRITWCPVHWLIPPPESVATSALSETSIR
jgi:hypothetical protein